MATKTATKTVKPKANALSTTSSKSNQSKTHHSRTALIIIGGIFLFLLGMFVLKSFLIAATVNGQFITRVAVIKELEKQGGQQTLEGLITKSLILQEAQKRNIVIGDDEINAKIKEIEDSLKSQQTTLDEALKAQGMTRDDLIRDIKLQILVQKLVEEKISLTDEEVAAYVKENDSFFPEDTTEEKKLQEGREQLKQQKISLETQNLIDQLRKNSKTVFFVTY